MRAGITADDKSITTIQAFAIMFLVDCAGAISQCALLYLKVVIEDLASLDFLEINGNPQVWEDTFCGIRNLNVLLYQDCLILVTTNRLSEWVQMTFQVPPIVPSIRLIPFKENKEKIIDSKFLFYHFMNDQFFACPSLLVTTDQEKSKLIEIINENAIIIYSQYGPAVSAHDFLQQYS